MRTGRRGEVERLLQALGDPTRLSVVELLSSRPRRAGELSDGLGIPAPTMSKHLRVLLQAGIVTDRRPLEDARVRIFQLRPESALALRAWLDQLQAHWDDQLRSFKRHEIGRAHV